VRVVIEPFDVDSAKANDPATKGSSKHRNARLENNTSESVDVYQPDCNIGGRSMLRTALPLARQISKAMTEPYSTIFVLKNEDRVVRDRQ